MLATSGDAENDVDGVRLHALVNAQLRDLTDAVAPRYERRTRRRRGRRRGRKRLEVSGSWLVLLLGFYVSCLLVIQAMQGLLCGAGSVARSWFAAEIARAQIWNAQREARSAGRRARRAHSRQMRAMHGNTRPPDLSGGAGSASEGESFVFNPLAAPFVASGQHLVAPAAAPFADSDVLGHGRAGESPDRSEGTQRRVMARGLAPDKGERATERRWCDGLGSTRSQADHGKTRGSHGEC